MTPTQIVLIVAGVIVLAVIMFFFGLVVGITGAAGIERDRQRRRDFAGVQERWAGHVSHRGHKF